MQFLQNVLSLNTMKLNMKIFDIYSSEGGYQKIFIVRVSDSERCHTLTKFFASKNF